MGFFGWVFYCQPRFQEELTGRIDYDLYAIGLGILMIVASLLLIDPFHAILSGQFVCCWVLIAGCHPLVCCSVAESSLLCDRRQLIAGPVLAILLCGSILIALLILQIGSCRFIAEVVSLSRAFREEVLSNYVKCDFLQTERPLCYRGKQCSGSVGSVINWPPGFKKFSDPYGFIQRYKEISGKR